MKIRFMNWRKTALALVAIATLGGLLAFVGGGTTHAASNVRKTDIAGYQATAQSGHDMTAFGATLKRVPTLSCPQPKSGGGNNEAGLGSHPYGWDIDHFKDAMLLDIIVGCNAQGSQEPNEVWAEVIPTNLADGFMYPMPGLQAVKTTDELRLSVSRSGNLFTFTAKDLTTGQLVTYQATCPDPGGCASPDAIVGTEASGGATSDNPANFGTSNWINITASDNAGHSGVFYQPSVWTMTQLQMFNPGNTVQCVNTHNYNVPGNAISYTWLRYGCGSYVGGPALGPSFTPAVRQLLHDNPALEPQLHLAS